MEARCSYFVESQHIHLDGSTKFSFTRTIVGRVIRYICIQMMPLNDFRLYTGYKSRLPLPDSPSLLLLRQQWLHLLQVLGRVSPCQGGQPWALWFSAELSPCSTFSFFQRVYHLLTCHIICLLCSLFKSSITALKLELHEGGTHVLRYVCKRPRATLGVEVLGKYRTCWLMKRLRHSFLLYSPLFKKHLKEAWMVDFKWQNFHCIANTFTCVSP